MRVLTPLSAPPNDRPPFQFTLRQLLGVMAAVCVLCAAYYWLGIYFVVFSIAFACLAFFAFALDVAERYRILHAVSVVAVLFLLLGLLLPFLSVARDTPRWVSCQYNMRNIALALQNYHDEYNSFPPAYISDADGKPMHSWRVLLLPFIEQQALYSLYRFDEPWDGPNNSQLHAHRVRLFECPSDDCSTRNTSYVVVTGPQTMWPNQKPTKFSDVKDGLGNTILFAEVHNSGIHWMEPRDLDIAQMPMEINSDKGLSISSEHLPQGFANVMFADGKPQRIPNSASAKSLRAALTISGGEKDKLPTAKLPR